MSVLSALCADSVCCKDCSRDITPALTFSIPLNCHSRASTVLAEIRRQIEQLRRHPLMGRSGRVEGTRELVVSRYPYVVAYQLAEDTVDILAVIHCARLWPEVL